VTGDALGERLAAVRERIARAAVRAGRDPAQVALVGVSKRKPVELVVAAVRAGLGAVGENYVQEAVPKIEAVRAQLEAEGTPLPRWHFIGRLQRNKARHAASAFDVVETLDGEALGAELERRAARAGRTLEVLLQVNLCGEAQKGGARPEALPALLELSRGWPHLRVSGLMTIPAASRDPETSRPVFAKLRELAESLRRAPGGAELRELSMGMSADFEIAIEEGATLVRVGTAIFGPRE
jgi:pyridoxal phosphate enzyme (YggS family)